MRYSRTRAGCLTCRARRKKCDETKPRCAGCRRNQLPCNWPPNTVSEDSDQPDSNGSAGTVVTIRGRNNVTMSNRQTPRTSHATNVARYQQRSTTTNLSPTIPIIHAGAESEAQRACMLTPQSVTLLSHFLMHTASFFAMGPLQDNPFVNMLLPMAYTEDLLMHALLALSGAHLTSREPDMGDLSRATSMHYAKLIGGLRSEFSGLKDGDLEKKESLLRLLMVACHYEALSGNPHGALFSHLKASRHLITTIIPKSEGKAGRQHIDVSPSTLGFSIELYTYLVLCNTIVAPHALHQPSSAEVFVLPMEEMASFPTFGSLFAGSHDLYRLIPEIGDLASRRLDEEQAGVADPSEILRQVHDKLYSRLSQWEMPPPSWSREPGWDAKCLSAEAWRNALHIYLATSLDGSIVKCATRQRLTKHLIDLFWCVRELVSEQQNYVATLLWPVIIGTSCIVKPEDQETMMQQLRDTWSSMRHMGLLADVCQLMWDDADPRAYGPYGLSMTMEKHRKWVGIL